MEDSNRKMLIDAADSIISNAETMQKGAAIGKKAMDNFTRYSASVHSFSVYTYMDPDFENVAELTTFQKSLDQYTNHYVALRNLIDVKVDQKAAVEDFKQLKEALDIFKQAIENY